MLFNNRYQNLVKLYAIKTRSNEALGKQWLRTVDPKHPVYVCTNCCTCSEIELEAEKVAESEKEEPVAVDVVGIPPLLGKRITIITRSVYLPVILYFIVR